MLKLDKEIKDLLIDYFGDEEEFEKNIEKLPEKAVAALKKALELINKYSVDFPSDLKDAIGILAKYSTAYGYGYGYPAKPVKKSVDKFPQIVNAMEKIGGDEVLEFEKLQAALGDPNKKFPSISRFLEPNPLENEGDD